MPRDPGQRLQKALAQLGLGSRREVEGWIRAGRLTVNGEPAALGARVHPNDLIRLDGRLVRRRAAAARQVFVCHRSPGEPLERPRDPAPDDRGPLLERLPHAGGRRFIAVSPMPRSDGGLELVTADGELAAQLQRAARELSAEFSVRTHGELGEAQLASVREGRLDRDTRLAVSDCAASGGEGSNRWYSLVVRGASGKELRRLFEHAGAVVSRVLRTRLGPVALDRRLTRGQFRRLTAAELHELLGAVATRGESLAELPPAGPRRGAPAGPRRPGRRRPTAHRSSGR
ncbi:MAG TPA: S4 domain-containing protein [Steroidobacteraceae bacterium]|nr:S4 domain-containing protein [Steroidobacteraceae bacterium]